MQDFPFARAPSSTSGSPDGPRGFQVISGVRGVVESPGRLRGTDRTTALRSGQIRFSQFRTFSPWQTSARAAIDAALARAADQPVVTGAAEEGVVAAATEGDQSVGGTGRRSLVANLVGTRDEVPTFPFTHALHAATVMCSLRLVVPLNPDA
jgi:hypothetical protein